MMEAVKELKPGHIGCMVTFVDQEPPSYNVDKASAWLEKLFEKVNGIDCPP